MVCSMVSDVDLSSNGSMLSPVHEVKILVFSGLTMHPRDFPNRSISVQKNSMSSCATVDEISSI